MMKNNQQSLAFIEKLRLEVVRQKIISVCKALYDKEQNNPNGYDVNASCAAILDYQEIALKIEVETAETYFNVLTEKIHYARDHCAYPGEYNGGKASYGSVHNRVEDWYQNELIYYSQIKLMRLAFYYRFMA